MATKGCDILNGYAFSLMRAGDYVKATYWLRRALDMSPNDPHALNNLASSLKALGREPEAIRIYERLTKEQPEFTASFNNLAFSYLRNGDYARGWEMYHNRLRANAKLQASMNPRTGRPFHEMRLPDADYIRGKHLLIVPEQGLGDELFLLRFLPKIIERAQPASVWYAPSVKLYGTLREMDVPAHLTDMSFASAPIENAVAVPLGDLPLISGHDGTWFPESLTYKAQAPSPDLLEYPRLGVTWRAGNPELVHRGGISKTLPPQLLGMALKDDPRHIVVFQRNMTDKEFSLFKDGLGHDRVEVFKHDPQPTAEIASIEAGLATLDEYVGVSNTNMHLLAAMGRTARVLVIHPAEWRWPVTNPKESPWFPGFRLYRQTVTGWEKALEELQADLRHASPALGS